MLITVNQTLDSEASVNICKTFGVCVAIFLLLGGCSEFGDSRNLRRTLKGANAGDANAQYDLGMMYADGISVPQDDAEAVKWFRLAGETDAQYNLGVMYANGEGVPKDAVEAYAWLSVAAAQGLKDAAKTRDAAKEKLTPEQLKKGQRQATEFFERYGSGK